MVLNFHGMLKAPPAGEPPAARTGIAECATFLRQYNRWRRGLDDAIVGGPNPRELGLHIDFAIEVMAAMSGHDHLMVIAAFRYCLGRQTYIAAFRYCLGRQTYIVGDCADWLIKTWPLLSAQTKAIIQRDLEDEFRRDDEARSDGHEYKPLGADCDRFQWARVRKLWAEL